MPAYNKVIIEGSLPGGEVWTCGLSYGGAFLVGTVGDLTLWATNIGVAIQAMVSNSLINILSSTAAITQIRTELRDENDILGLAGEAPLTPPKQGQGNPTKVHQASLCISLLTTLPGRSFRGRIYWPAYGYTAVTTTQRFALSDVLSWITAFRTINTAIIDAAPPTADLALIVRSRLRDENTPVARIAGGDVPDVQRRRRDALLETYQAITV